MKKISVLFVVIDLLVGCVSTPPIADIQVRGDSITYRGSINRESNERLFEVVEIADQFPATLVITSKGGETLAGIELGQWVFRNSLNVTVTEYCVSSCANYIFTAGKVKTLNPEAAVVWHGGALQEEWNAPCSGVPKDLLNEGLHCAEVEQIQAEKLEEFKTAEEQFFAEIGVDQRITVLGQDPEYDCRGGTSSLGWYYSINDLERLGVKNIRIQQGDWRPESPARNLTICRVELGADFH